MLYLPPGTGIPQRVHGAFVSDDEVHRVVDYLKTLGEARVHRRRARRARSTAARDGGEGGEAAEADPLYDQAVRSC